MRKLLLSCLTLSFLLVCGSVSAQSRQDLIAELLHVQGLDELFAENLEQSKLAAQQVGREAMAQLFSAAPNLEPTKRARIESIFQQYLDQCASMWQSTELMAIWTKNYGNDLSEAELSQILAYYKSPLGAKDVAAAKAATRAFTAEVNREGQRRVQASLRALVTNIQNEMRQ